MMCLNRLVAKIQEELQDMVNRLADTGRKYDIQMNINKSQSIQEKRIIVD